MGMNLLKVHGFLLAQTRESENSRLEHWTMWEGQNNLKVKEPKFKIFGFRGRVPKELYAVSPISMIMKI